jgi:general secretion pathway protein K
VTKPLLTEPRRGFALLLVLWFTVGITALTAAAMAVAHDALAAQQNRRDYLSQLWVVRGCLAEVRATADGLLADTLRFGPNGARVWRRLGVLTDSALRSSTQRCELEFRPSGTRLDVNQLGPRDLRHALASLGINPAAADSLTDALLDWRDSDDEPRPSGAEHAWYRTQQRLRPRNGALRDMSEILLVKGWERMRGTERLFGVARERVVPAYAPAEVVRALPGIGDEAASRFQEMRREREWAPSWAALSDNLSRAGRDSLAPHIPQLEERTVDAPDSWHVHLRAHEERGRSSFEMVATMVRDSRGVAVPFMRIVWR